MIIAKVVLICPQTKDEVTLHKNCKDCSYFKHFGYRGWKLYVACKYEEENADKSGA